jgi:carbonic anhydrase
VSSCRRAIEVRILAQHFNCSASPPGDSSRGLSEHIFPAYEEARVAHPNSDERHLIKEAVRQNVRRAIRDLLQISDGVRRKAEAGDIKVVGAVYDLQTGEVEWFR